MALLSLTSLCFALGAATVEQFMVRGWCQAEDAGGWPGCARLVQILTDPNHEEHQDMLGWLGLDNRNQFHPTRFASDEANRRLTAVSHPDPSVSRR